MATESATPRILLTGKDGQVGHELQRVLAALGSVTAVGRPDCDLADAAALRALVAAVRPDVIVNPAAYTAVDKAESEPAAAHAVNAEAPGVLAGEAQRHGALLIHYSTDYVFDGRKTAPYTEQDAPAPQSVYGRSKLAGEDAIRRSGCRHLILRTSWVYGAHGGNFLKTILRLAAERSSLRIVADQVGAPTSAALIADVTGMLLQRHLQRRMPLPDGIYHLAAAGEISWHGYAKLVVQLAAQAGLPLALRPEDVAPIGTADYPLPAPRPANSRLATGKLQSTLGITLPPWQAGVAEVINQLAKP
jgi:dTDP-4-dehydrorhamnose reductase